MRRLNKFSVVFAIAATLLTGSVFAADKEVASEKLYQNILKRIDMIEQNSPKNEAQIMELRNSVEQLYRQMNGTANLTDPVDENGRFLNVDLKRGTNMYDDCKGLKDEALKRELLGLIKNHYNVGYQKAQDIVFEDLDNVNGYVECIYTGRKLKTDKEPPSTNMNIEHTWPQSKGASGIAKADLHHLFPADSKTNGKRGNFPFGWVKNPSWEQGGSKFADGVFEVRPKQRGDTARGMFYFAVRYGYDIDAKQEKVLRQWHKEDPVDEYEKKRNDRIENHQHNRNPFIDHPEFVDMISNL